MVIGRGSRFSSLDKGDMEGIKDAIGGAIP